MFRKIVISVCMTIMQSRGFPRSPTSCRRSNSFSQRSLDFFAALTSQLTPPVCTLLPDICFFSEKILTAFQKCFIPASCTMCCDLTSVSVRKTFLFLFCLSRAKNLSRSAFYFGKTPAFRLYFVPRVLSLYHILKRKTPPGATDIRRLQPGGRTRHQGKARHHGRGNQRKT